MLGRSLWGAGSPAPDGSYAERWDRSVNPPTLRDKEPNMESLTSGTLAGTGSFRCEGCGYVVTLAAADALPDCPGCSGHDFTRASLFGAPRFTREHVPERDLADEAARIAETRAELSEPGEYLAFEDGAGMRAVPLTREWTRIGRSLAADIRFDDPTVSR